MYPWCINKLNYHGNLSRVEIDNITSPWEGDTLHYKKSKLKHLCTEGAKTVNAETVTDYLSTLFSNMHMYLGFKESRFNIFTLMQIPRDLSGKVFSLSLEFGFTDDISWVDVSVERKKVTKCHGTNNLYPHENVNLTEPSSERYSIKRTLYKRKHVLLDVTFPENISEKVQLSMKTTAKYKFNSLFKTDMNKYQKLVSEKYFELVKDSMGYLLFFHDKITSVRLRSFESNSTGVVHVHGIEMCNQKFSYLQEISVEFKCYNKKDECWYRCLNYSSSRDKAHSINNHYYAFIYHPNIYELKLKETCTRNKYVERQWKCRGFPVDILDDCLKGSWNEASQTCKEYGGHLPIIRSKDEQAELISLLYLSKIPPPFMTVMFIGLIGYQV